MKDTNRLIKVLIADDEPSAREAIEFLLKKDAEIEVCGLCSNGQEAVEAILKFRPDLVFLDIQMPELDGFEVLEALQEEFLPEFIFVTAFDQYAIKAFEKSAVDYLLKPFDDERFYKSVEKGKKAVASHNTQQQVEKVENLLNFIQASTISKSGTYHRKLTIKNNGRITFLPVDKILYIESEGSFVKIHTESGFKIGNYTFKILTELLNPNHFVRIHKSYIVNVDFVEGLEPHFHGDYNLFLKNGSSLRLSRNYSEALQIILNQQG